MSTIQPLTGIRVLDFSRLLPGPYASLLLADLGAEVIKVEDPDSGGDYARMADPMCDDGNSALFHALNRGKKSITLSVRTEDDRMRLMQLVAGADVVLESFRPGVLQKLFGHSARELVDAHPGLIICSISGYGQSNGELTLRAGHDLNYCALAGVLGMSKRPAPLPVQVADLAAGAWPAAFQILAALQWRARTKSVAHPKGRGTVIDVSMTAGAHSLLVMPLARAAVDPDSPISKGHDMLCGALPCYDVYPTADGWITVGALEPKFWGRLVKALGVEDVEDGAMATGTDGDRVSARLTSLFRTRTTAEWDAFLAAHDIMVEVVKEPTEVAANFKRIPVVIDGRTVHLPATPLSMGPDLAINAGRAPNMGEHNDQVFASLPKARL